MKSLANRYVSKEDKQKIVNVGDPFHAIKTYTRADFLTPLQVSKKFKISAEEAEKTMKRMVLNRAVFGLNGHKTPIIVKLNSHIRLHPMACEAFQKYIDSKKVR